MEPITGMVEKKVAESLWTVVRNWFQRKHDQQKGIESLQALTSARDACGWTSTELFRSL
jgi:hypothetical protein